jgi:hypothetical protein
LFSCNMPLGNGRKGHWMNLKRSDESVHTRGLCTACVPRATVCRGCELRGPSARPHTIFGIRARRVEGAVEQEPPRVNVIVKLKRERSQILYIYTYTRQCPSRGCRDLSLRLTVSLAHPIYKSLASRPARDTNSLGRVVSSFEHGFERPRAALGAARPARGRSAPREFAFSLRL